jgi:hypothetical protein
MTAVGYISDTQEIVKDSSSLFQHDCTAEFKLSERSPVPPALSGKNLPGGRTHIVHVRPIWRINRHPVESDDDSAPKSISDSEDCLNSNADLNIGNDSEGDCAVHVEYDIQRDNRIDDPQYPEQRAVNDMPNVPELIRPTRQSKRPAEKLVVTVNAMETRMIKGVKK